MKGTLNQLSPEVPPPTLRRRLYLQLDPAARKSGGLSWINLVLVALILAAGMTAMFETEPLVYEGNEWLFRLSEVFFGTIFLVEYAARLWVAVEDPRFARYRFPRLRYALTPIALIDLVAILPALFAFAIGGTLLLRLLRLVRLLRLAKIGRFSRAWRHVADAVHSRRFELGLTLLIGTIAMMLSATALFWAEADAQPEKFGSVPRALWWSVVTLTTVGYGDVFPVTPVGKVISAVVAVIGIGLIALPTGILAAAFSDAIQRHREQDRREETGE